MDICRAAVDGLDGLEIGGPSRNFGARGLLPVYSHVGRLDNCNFADSTVWEGHLEAGVTFKFDNAHAPGRQFIAEATDLGMIGSQTYDFVLSSHALEHSANPIRALREIIRVLKESGVLVLVLPHQKGAFDHRRPVTPLSHLIEDDAQNTTEHDLTHLPEILALHDLALDPEAGDAANFAARSQLNFENRCLHHHVFDTALAVSLVEHVGMQVLVAEYARPLDIIVIARKPPRVGSVQ